MGLGFTLAAKVMFLKDSLKMINLLIDFGLNEYT
jgi:hypothetical protein